MRTATLRWPWLGFALALVILAGCNGPITGESVRQKLFDPGSFAYQRYEAEVFDPYPEPNVGPEVVGGRPPWYQTPAPEAQRTRDALRYRFGAVPPYKYSPQMP